MSLPISWTDRGKHRPPEKHHDALTKRYASENVGRNISVPDYARGVVDGYDLAKRLYPDWLRSYHMGRRRLWHGWMKLTGRAWDP